MQNISQIEENPLNAPSSQSPFRIVRVLLHEIRYPETEMALKMPLLKIQNQHEWKAKPNYLSTVFFGFICCRCRPSAEGMMNTAFILELSR
jgi:hypothetical protein